MISNASLKEIGAMLREAQSILMFPHVGPDGDALGSCAALCRAMRMEGKDAWVLLDEPAPGYLSFMDTEFFTDDSDILENPDICICIDCSEESRFQERADKFNEGRLKLCIDHHVTSGSFGDYYYIDGGEAATAQIIYKLLKAMNIVPDKTIAESIYVGINTDTGSFRHSNTTPETHIIAADLLKAGINHQKIIVSLYNNVSYKRVRLESEIIDKIQMAADGKVAVSYVTQTMLERYDAVLEDCEGAVDILKNIEGVELAAFLKEKGRAVKVSMRAKSYGNVDRVAVKFGGGGHVKAAGCTLEMTMNEAVDLIKKELSDYWEN